MHSAQVVETEREQLEGLRKRRREKDTQLQAGQETPETDAGEAL